MLKNKLLKLFRSKKEYVSCKWLEYGIIFDHANIVRVCCAQSHEGGGRYILKHNYQGELIDWEDIFAQKRIQRKVQKGGKTYEKCRGCVLLEKGEWSQDDYIGALLLTHWIHCNCACVYCPAVRDEELIKNNKHYNVVPALKDLMSKNLLKKDAYVSIAGGEATIYPEFEELLHSLLDYGMNNICISTSGIKYSEAIEKGISTGGVAILVSLDAGTKETHKKLKLTDTFDNVIENLRAYSNVKQYDYQVSTKYIIVPEINDTKEEITSWLEINKELKINEISMDIEISWYNENHENIPKHINDLILFSEKKAKDLGLKLTFFDRASMQYKKIKRKKMYK